jgi:predicted RNA-binding protein with RPS1 domain
MEIKLQIGDTVIGEVVGLKPYGAFIKLPTEDIGMVHISEVAEEYVKEISEYLEIGQQVAVKIIGVHHEGKYNLSLRHLTKQDAESAQFSREVQEAREVLETRREAILESAWKRPVPEPKVDPDESHAEILEWVARARVIAKEVSRRSDSRQRSITSIDL